MSLKFTECGSASDPRIFPIARKHQRNVQRRWIEARPLPAISNLVQEGREHRGHASPDYDGVGFEEIDDVSESIRQQIQSFAHHLFGPLWIFEQRSGGDLPLQLIKLPALLVD